MSDKITLAHIQRLREWAKGQETQPQPPVMFYNYATGKWERT